MARKIFNIVLGLTLLISLISIIPAQVVQAADPQPEGTTYPYATDHLIIKLREEARVDIGTISTHIASLDRTLTEMKAVALEALPGLPDTYLVKLDSKGANILSAVNALSNDPAVEYAEPDYLAKFASIPDDPRFSEQWSLTKVQAENAWDQTMGAPSVVIAIIDSGIDLTHEDLAPNLWTNPGEIPANSIDDDNNGFVDDVQGWNFVNATNNVQDFIGHGSMVAGVAAARTNNTLGIAGMCGNCRIMPVKVTQVSGFANYSDIAAGVIYATNKGARVINLSVGGYADSPTLRNAINAALADGIVVVGGAGNDNSSNLFYPAAYEGVIAVAGTDENDQRVNSSNYGSWVDISAPGVNILSTTLGDYASDAGTSYAAPFVSGAAGLLLSLHPDWTPAMVRSQFLHTTDAIDGLNPGFEELLGSGRLNAAAATQPAHPILVYNTYTGNGIVGFRPDFGSTVSLAVTLYNDWADAADVTGTLSSADPFVTITTSEAAFGTIVAGASQANPIPFSFNIAAEAGYNHPMPFTLALSADGGAYTTVVDFTITTRSSEEPVSGTIDVDTTWTSDKIYKVTGNIGVAPGFTLTLEPGTVVKFAGNYSLNVGGTLIAQGTAALPIRFEPYSTGDTWNRIFLDDTSLDAVTTAEGVYQSGNILQYVTLTGAASGIGCTTATPFLAHVTTDQGGLSCSLGDTDLWLQDATFVGAISVTQGGSTPEHLTRVTVYGNTTLPASQVSDSSFKGSLTIQGSGLVSHTTTSGLSITGTGDVQDVASTGSISISSGQVIDSEAEGGSIVVSSGGTISGCATLGGGLSAGSGSTVTHNNIESAPGNGITTSGNSTVTFNRIVGANQGIAAGAGTVENNLIARTTGDGLRPGTASVRNNTFIEIAGNGVYLQSVPAAFEYNNFEFNTGTYDVYVTVPKTTIINLVAQNNWWGTTDSNLIKERTWDYYDDYNLAKLITGPVLTAPSQTAPGYVRSITLDPASPVGIQTVDYTVEFSRPMDMETAPDLTFHSTLHNTWTTYNTDNSGLPGNSVYAIAIDTDGSKWFVGKDVGVGPGVAHFDGTTWIVYNTGNSGLPNSTVYAITIDTDGSKWFGTYGTGVAHFDGTTWTVYNTGNSGLPSDTVHTIAIDADGSKWFGTMERGAAHFDGTTWTVYNTGNSGLPDNEVRAIGIDADGSKWFGTSGGLARFDGTTWTVYNTGNSGLPDHHVVDIAIDADGSKWFGTYGGAAHFDGTTWTVYNQYNSGLPSNQVYAVAIDADGSKWFGTGGGVAHFDGITWMVYNTDNSGLPSNTVRAIAIDSEGSKWFGTLGGGVAAQWNESTFTIQDNPVWLDETHFRASYDFTALIERGDYRLTVTDAVDGSGITSVPVSNTTFSVDYAGEISDTTPPDAPVVSAWGDGSLTQLSAQAYANDPDSEIVGYRYAIGSAPGGSDVVNWTNTSYTEITRTGLLLQPDQPYYVSFQARNPGGLWSPIGVSNAVTNGIVPNEPPVATNDSYDMNEDAPLTVAAPGVLENDTDADGDPLTAILVTGPEHGTLTLNSDGSFIYSPEDNWNGSDSFTYKADDGTVDSNPVAVALAVSPVNDLPVAVNDSYTANEDASLTVAAPGVLENDTDTDGDPLSAILVTGPEHGTLTLNSDGSFTYSPEDNWNGSDSFTYKANDGATDSNPAAVTLTVNPVNDAPVAADDTASTNEDTQVDIPVSTLLVNDSDVDGDALSLVEINNVTSGTVALVGETITFTPTTNFHGEAGFDYTITDDTTLDTAHVTIMVTPLNDPPTASNDSYSTNEDTPLTVATPGVLENDTDADGDLLNAILVTGPQHGTLTLNPDGSFTYSPDIDWSGIDSFRYKSNDGLEDSNTATVTITVVSAIEWKFIYLPLVFK